jgi:hypothetical protein
VKEKAPQRVPPIGTSSKFQGDAAASKTHGNGDEGNGNRKGGAKQSIAGPNQLSDPSQLDAGAEPITTQNKAEHPDHIRLTTEHREEMEAWRQQGFDICNKVGRDMCWLLSATDLVLSDEHNLNNWQLTEAAARFHPDAPRGTSFASNVGLVY